MPLIEAFFDQISTILGPDNVSRDSSAGALVGPKGKTAYGDPYPLDEAVKRSPVGAVRPSTVEEVQAVIRAANVFHVRLWTVSRGKNLGYGGTCPVVNGTVVLDLHRMTKIIEINEEFGYAIVEPGVSFFDVYEEIQKRKLKLWPSCPAIGWGSILGNTLDRGFGYTPGGEHSQVQCGMEVVLPSGELLRTGMGAMPDSKLFGLYKGGFGPSIDGLFFQSNFGVATKLGYHVTPAPEAYCRFKINFAEEEDLIPMIDTLTDLLRRNIIGNSPSVSNIFRDAIVSGDPDAIAAVKPYLGTDKYVPYDVMDKLRRQKGWGFWTAHFALYGSREVVPALRDTVKRAFAKVPGATIKECELYTAPEDEVLNASIVGEEEIPNTGVPTLSPLGLLDFGREPGSYHTCFSPLIPPSGKALYDWYITAKKRTVDARFDFFADFHVYARYVIGIELVMYTDAEKERMKGSSFMDDVASHFDFNGGVFNKFLTRIKDSLDPNGILSPGKSGVWNSAGPGSRLHGASEVPKL
ncbi:vanillyl-alcohol oxidase [Grosmannia clavigera kw1407]|uniref:Vanillyl-alcohol oxidase n=1 Tax=Grosmannia clavigera (strain kw1407 / UAMH 11150) TaxID=655863 RepID=F0XEU9_GROCL|nr:vanillyl-alcohol oxidase [Grosmannia clavigera kw1407]EFX04236.1 vanillyl-alcohol oxidase [Grosmannia clavigera kw1407]